MTGGTAIDASHLAALHRLCLPKSAVSRLGTHFATRFYRFIQASPAEFLLWEHDGRQPVAVAMVSLSPSNLALRGILPAFLAPSPRRNELPELVHLFTSPSKRRSGMASRLLERVDQELRRRGITTYCVYCPRGADAELFYEKKGFVKKSTASRHLNDFFLMTKSI